MSSPLSWRAGRKVGRTVYDANDKLIGFMDTAEDAAFVVAVDNGLKADAESIEVWREEVRKELRCLKAKHRDELATLVRDMRLLFRGCEECRARLAALMPKDELE